MNFSRKITYCIYAIMLFISACKKENSVIDQPNGDATKFSSTIAVEWMDIFRNTVKSQRLNPPQASRIYAYAGIGLYEAVVDGIADNKSLQGQLNGLYSIPRYEKPVDYELVANQALYFIAKNIFSNLSVNDNAILESKKINVLESKKQTVSSDVINNSIERGSQIGQLIITWSKSDFFTETRTMSYTVPSDPSHPEYWKPTDAVNLKPLEPYWSKIRTFAMTNASSCYIASAIPFSTVESSAFYNQANEVVTVKSNLTPEQKDIALWWADSPGATSTPPGHWLSIENIIAQQKNLNLAQAAEMYALSGMAMGDAFISCWECKYRDNLLRPITYIRQYISAQSNWQPLLSTPPFPEYTSGHSVCSGAVATVLTHLFGESAFTDNTNTYTGIAQRSFSSFNDAAQEAAISRLYGGIHYREAIETGLKQGELVGKAVINKIKLK